MSKLEKPSALKREHPALQKMIFIFFVYLWVIFATQLGIKEVFQFYEELTAYKYNFQPTFFAGSGTFIPDPNFFHPGYRIRIKEFKYLNPKLFLSSRKYNPGCSSRILILIFYPSRIPDPRVKKAPDPRSGAATLDFCRLKSIVLSRCRLLTMWRMPRHHVSSL
jgi:hypothetical protein